jgi:flagellar biosynthesis/type III secretory pathway M-ring protein FliF/YscJ
MHDEHTELLKQILEVEKEQLAFSRQQREEFMAIQQAALAAQRHALRWVRFLIWLVLIIVAALIVFMIGAPCLRRTERASNLPDQARTASCNQGRNLIVNEHTTPRPILLGEFAWRSNYHRSINA